MLKYDTYTSSYKSALLEAVSHGFGTKLNGNGQDLDVIKSLLKREKIRYEAIAIPHQTHSTNVIVLSDVTTDTDVVAIENSDGLITKEKGIVLTVVTADCVPTLYYDDVAHVIGISHGGWKGTLNNIPGKVIEKMELIGAEANRIKVAIGPSIRSCCYEIYGERYEQFLRMYGNAVFTKRDSKVYLRLELAQELLLHQAGILPKHIEISSLCTSCESSKFYSYRRDKRIEGEMITFIALP